MVRLTRPPDRLGRSPLRVKAVPKRAEGFYTSEGWRTYRKRHRERTIAKQGGLWCARCGVGENAQQSGKRVRLILDHKVERRDGGEDFPPFEGAEWLCTSCHNRKTAKAKAARASGSPPRKGRGEVESSQG